MNTLVKTGERRRAPGAIEIMGRWDKPGDDVGD
jgi:hypothetical protein